MPLKSEMIERAMVELRDEYRYHVKRKWDGWGWGNCLYIEVFYGNKTDAVQELKFINAILYGYNLVGSFKGAIRSVRCCGELWQVATIEVV